MAFQSGAFQSSAFQGTDVVPTNRNSFAGFGRQWYRYKGRSLHLSPFELAYLLKQDEELDRQSVKVKRKKKHRTINRDEWARIMESMSSLNVGMVEPIAAVDDYDDEEAALEMLLMHL
jgi:hypothetical protein